MKGVPVVAVDKATGQAVANAQQVLCPRCEGETFRLYIIAGHNHVVCNGCAVAFCEDGGHCTAGLEIDPPPPPSSEGLLLWRKSSEGTLHAFLGPMQEDPAVLPRGAKSACGLVTLESTTEAELESGGTGRRPVCGHCNRYLQRIAMEGGAHG